MPLYMDGGFTVNESDNNNYYNTGGSLTYWGNSVYQTVEAMSEATGQDENSVSTDPNWQDLFTCVTCNDTLSDAGTPLSTVEPILLEIQEVLKLRTSEQWSL